MINGDTYYECDEPVFPAACADKGTYCDEAVSCGKCGRECPPPPVDALCEDDDA